ncbi:MAG: folate-binding protein [Acidobacteriales bacterium]|nr:folate-binding protein [Terriglobales bacterium]
MVRTSFYDVLTASGATFGEYRGAKTPVRFTDVQTEIQALRSGCALYDLSWQARMVVTGEDRQRWLNGMVTNNIRDLEENRGVYSFLLTPQGRILGDMFVYHRGDRMLIDTDWSQAAKLKEAFERYIIMDDVEISTPAGKNAIGIEGPRAQQLLQSVGLEVDNMQPLEIRSLGEVEVIYKLQGAHAGYEAAGEAANIAALWDQLDAARATPVGFEALELWRIAKGVPRYGQDISERYLPQETEQMHALHFSKGCYVGQEIVERIRSRGQVHRGFAGIAIEEASTEIAPGAKIQREGKDVGEITSVALLPAHNGSGSKKVALGYIRREAQAPGLQVQVNGAAARVAKLPFE